MLNFMFSDEAFQLPNKSQSSLPGLVPSAQDVS